MSRIKYRDIKLSKTNKQRLDEINSIIREYQQDGYVLTLRQLYYQLVSREVIPNKQSEYAKLSKLLKEGRMAGIVDWDAIEDRLRRPESPNQFDDTDDAMETIIDAYALPRMRGQKNYLEVWVEKDALSGVLSRVTSKYHVPILVNRGYSSVSAMHDAFIRLRHQVENHDREELIIIYLGDFDPSGQDMIRDIRDRLDEFMKMDYSLTVIPAALTMEQIRKYKPPPNPAKMSDPRAGEYVSMHGTKSWEVDALPPKVLNKLLEDYILQHIDIDMYNKILKQEKIDKKKLEQGKAFVYQLEIDEEE